ncbi:MAG: hypothetical protein SGPRY_011729, partial [Prymnesium sp.]
LKPFINEKSLLDDLAFIASVRKEFKLHHLLFIEVMSHIPIEANSEDTFSLSKKLSNPNSDTGSDFIGTLSVPPGMLQSSSAVIVHTTLDIRKSPTPVRPSTSITSTSEPDAAPAQSDKRIVMNTLAETEETEAAAKTSLKIKFLTERIKKPQTQLAQAN